MSGATVSARLTKPATSVRLAVSTSSTISSPTYSSPVTPVEFQAKMQITDLAANTQYYCAVEIDGVLDTSVIGKFKTPPAEAGSAFSFKFAFSSCTQNGSNHVCHDRIRMQDILFFAHLGDLHYEDIATNSPARFRAAFDRQFGQPRPHQLFREVPTVYIFDDHDYGADDSNGSSASRDAALRTYRKVVPHHALENNAETDQVYHSFEIGRCLFIVTDLRSEASPKSATDNSSKTKMGATQKTWFKGLLSDPANAGKVLIWLSSSPFIPNASSGADHWGGYSTERREIADHVKAHCLGRFFVCSGDTHAIGLDDGTNGDFATGGGGEIREFTASPIDQTTGTWPATYSSGYIQNVGQFGIVEIVDTGGGTVTVNWTAMLNNGSTLSTMSFDVDL